MNDITCSRCKKQIVDDPDRNFCLCPSADENPRDRKTPVPILDDGDWSFVGFVENISWMRYLPSTARR